MKDKVMERALTMCVIAFALVCGLIAYKAYTEQVVDHYPELEITVHDHYTVNNISKICNWSSVAPGELENGTFIVLNLTVRTGNGNRDVNIGHYTWSLEIESYGTIKGALPHFLIHSASSSSAVFIPVVSLNRFIGPEKTNSFSLVFYSEEGFTPHTLAHRGSDGKTEYHFD